MDIFQLLPQYVNMIAVITAVALTQLLKYFLPSPTPYRTTEVESGKLWTRLMPLSPILIGVICCYFLEAKGWRFTSEIVVRGFLSGVLAAYAYRTMKVSLFGE